jgi:hypothetical protein
MRLSNVDLAQVTARRVADPAYTPRAVGLRPPMAETAEGAAIKRRQSSWL